MGNANTALQNLLGINRANEAITEIPIESGEIIGRPLYGPSNESAAQISKYTRGTIQPTGPTRPHATPGSAVKLNGIAAPIRVSFAESSPATAETIQLLP